MPSKNETSTVKELAVLLFVLRAFKTFECYKVAAFTYTCIALGEYSNKIEMVFRYLYWVVVVFYYLLYYLGFVTLSKGMIHDSFG